MTMAPTGTAAYVTDVPYPGFFHREATPTWLATAATALGRRAPNLAAPYTWMELGCGAGLGAALTAAAHPGGQCIGVDFNPGHIAQARACAQAAGLDNLHLLQGDFAHMAEGALQDVPPCDFIVLHGVYSWVSAATREAILRIVRQRLKPGGLLYLGYMSQPGPSAFAALQHLLLLHARQSAGPSDAQATAALRFAQQLRDAGAGYFATHPDIAAQLDPLARESGGYLAHELLAAHWQPLHAADVMAQCAQIGCRYVGSATLLENIDAVSVPEGVAPLLRGIADPALAETVRDFARNQSLRRDIYQRTDGDDARHALPEAEHRARLLAQALAPLPGLPARGPLVFNTRIGPVEAADALFTPLLRALQPGPQSYAALARLPAYAPRPGFLNQAFQMLCWAGMAHPLPTLPQVTGGPAWRLNRWLAARDGRGDEPLWLAAPALGTALPATPMQRLAAQALLREPALQGDALADAVSALAGAEPARGELADFERTVLPWWRRYGVVPAASSSAGGTEASSSAP